MCVLPGLSTLKNDDVFLLNRQKGLMANEKASDSLKLSNGRVFREINAKRIHQGDTEKYTGLSSTVNPDSKHKNSLAFRVALHMYPSSVISLIIGLQYPDKAILIFCILHVLNLVFECIFSMLRKTSNKIRYWHRMHEDDHVRLVFAFSPFSRPIFQYCTVQEYYCTVHIVFCNSLNSQDTYVYHA